MRCDGVGSEGGLRATMVRETDGGAAVCHLARPADQHPANQEKVIKVRNQKSVLARVAQSAKASGAWHCAGGLKVTSSTRVVG